MIVVEDPLIGVHLVVVVETVVLVLIWVFKKKIKT
jgi:hypothetical protein